MVQQLGSQPLQYRLSSMTKFVKWYLCGMYGREIYPTVVLFRCDWLQSIDLWTLTITGFPCYSTKWVLSLMYGAMNVARIIWPICLQNDELPPICYTLLTPLFGHLADSRRLYAYFSQTVQHLTPKTIVHTLQSVLVNGIINGGFLPPSAPDLVLCDWFLVVRHFKGDNV